MTSPSNVLFVVDDFAKGGAAVVVYNLIQRLDRSLFKPLLCCLDDTGVLGEELKASGVKVFYLNRQPGTDWGVIKTLRQIIKAENVDLIHAHQYTAFFYGGLAAISSLFKNLIFTEHGRHYPDQRNTKRVIVNKFMLPFTARIIAVSPAVKQSLITYEGMPGHRIEVIFNGIDCHKYNIFIDTANKKKELELSPTSLLCGMIARLGTEKDHATLIRAMSKITLKYPQARLLLIGDGPKKSELENLVRQSGLADKVIFTGSRRDIPELLAILDVAVLSTFYEGTSITLLEAMAAEKPVVASRVGGNPLVVEDGDNGFLVPPNNPEALADRLLQLFADESLRKKMGQAGRRHVQQQFSLNQMMANYEKLYQQILN